MGKTVLNFSMAKILVALHFSGNLLEIAYAKTGLAKPEILNLKICNIEGFSDEDVAKVIKDALKEFKVKRNCLIISTVDSQSVITKNIEIPSVDEKEIKEIIELQAGRYTPYAREEIVVEYVNIGTYHSSYTKVLIVIVVQNVVKRQINIFSLAGVSVSKIIFSAEGIGYACAKYMGFLPKATPTVMINIDNKNSDFIVFSKGKTIFIRNIPLGYDSFALDQKASVARFIEEAKKSLEAYRTEDIDNLPDELQLMGELDVVDAVKSSLASELGLPVKNAMLYGAVLLPKKAVDDNKRVSLVSIVSAVAAFFDTKIDLRPADLKLKIFFQERSRDIVKSGILVMAIIVFLCMQLLVKIHYRGLYLAALNTQVKTTEPQVDELDKKLTKIALIKRIIQNKNRGLNILSELYSIVPDDVYLKSITVGEDNKIAIKGTANAMSEVFTFVTAIEDSKFFSNASAQNTSNRKEGGKDVADFEITFTLEEKK